jgi:hypothetical protein
MKEAALAVHLQERNMTNPNRPEAIWRQIRDTVRANRSKAIDDDWKAIRSEATRLLDNLQAKYEELVHEAQRQIDRRREARQKPVVRFLRHNRWLPVVAGLGVITAVVVATRNK